jgi:hypothetical protein|tara:strand:- start:601 stop:783 length:183 start_codon:yes stop_codon:yes gene_type:complete
MSITKEEIIATIEADLADAETKLSSLMSTGSMSEDESKVANYIGRCTLLNDTKTWVTDNL